MECDHGGLSGRLIAMASSFAEADVLIKAMGTTRQDFLDYCRGKKEAPWAEISRLMEFIVREQGLLIAQHRKTEQLKQRTEQGDTSADR